MPCQSIYKDIIAEMAGVEKRDIEKILSRRMDQLEDEKKYRTAAAVMCLRFFLKENEPGQRRSG
ncbi:HTH domain-containing protein [Lientehia hominis]